MQAIYGKVHNYLLFTAYFGLTSIFNVFKRLTVPEVFFGSLLNIVN